MALRLRSTDADFAARFDALANSRSGFDTDVRDTVAAIVARIREEGDTALFELTEKFDRLALEASTIRLSAERIRQAEFDCPQPVILALREAARRIEAYHQRQKPGDARWVDESGVTLGWQWKPLRSVGLYVPGGRASYPSSVLMNAVPARVAGVERIAMVVPAPGGHLNPAILVAAQIAGVDEIYTIGGAQAVAALAYGTQSIIPVDKIVGPGNAWVTEAKRQVFGKVGIDTIAGPSEILVLADAKNNPAWIAADLLSQAEHDPLAQSILITDDSGFAAAVERAVQAELTTLPEASPAHASWRDHGAIIVVEHLRGAVALIDRLAPEHLELAIDQPDELAAVIHHAGAIFLGRHTPEPVGDYIAGPSHVLPTHGAARYASGLGVLDFMKRTSLIGCDAGSLATIGHKAAALAMAEGLPAHARSLTIRLDDDA